MRVKHLPLLALLTLSVASFSLASGACGGAQPAIKHRMPMDMLAQTPPEDRGPVAEAYRTHFAAQQHLEHVQFKLRDIEYELKIARAEKAKNKQAETIAKLEGKRSESLFMVDLAKSAGALLNSTKKNGRAQGERIRYLKAQRTYLRRELAHAKSALVQTEAGFELAKARLAKERNTVPKGFKLASFVSQESQAKARAQKKAQKAKSAQATAKVKEQAWKNASK